MRKNATDLEVSCLFLFGLEFSLAGILLLLLRGVLLLVRSALLGLFGRGVETSASEKTRSRARQRPRRGCCGSGTDETEGGGEVHGGGGGGDLTWRRERLGA